MLLRHRSPLLLALCLAVAACSADKPAEQAEAGKGGDAATAKPSVRDPRATSSAADRKPAAGPAPVRAWEKERPRQAVYAPRPTGFIECDQFAEKGAACINSGALSPADVQTLGDQFRAAFNDISYGNHPDMAKACTDLQQSLQPKLISAGCKNL